MSIAAIFHTRFGEGEHRTLGVVIFLGLVYGLFFNFLMPPWQHYDEPGHFEYAWLAANQSGWPQPGDYDQSMRREVAASMVENAFYDRMDFFPDLLARHTPVWIGIAQTGDRPLYYWLAALPLRVLRNTDISLQLYSARLISLGLYLLSILSAYGTAVEITQRGSPLRWMLPLTLVFFPSFVDLMTAVNNDVGAVAFFSLFIWAGVHLIRRGFSWFNLFFLLATAGACYWTKSTASVALVLILIPIIALILQRLQGFLRGLALGVVLVGVLGPGVSIFKWGDAAYWIRLTPPDVQTQVENEKAPLGNHAVQIVPSNAQPNPELVQIFSPALCNQLRGKTVTVGAWVWADQTVQERTPVLQIDGVNISEEITANPTPNFYVYTYKIPKKANRITIYLAPVHQQAGVSVYYDGVVVVEGMYPVTQEPRFEDESAKHGEWGGQTFTNLIQNGSAEAAWPYIGTWADQAISKRFPGRPSIILSTLLDKNSASWYYQAAGASLFKTFWAQFGWGHIHLNIQGFYYFLVAVTAAGIGGACFTFWKERKNLHWGELLFLGGALIIIWGAALLRGTSSLTGDYFLPSARYAFPAMIPTMLVILIGWLEIITVIEKKANPLGWTKMKWAVFGVFILSLNLLALSSIYSYYF